MTNFIEFVKWTGTACVITAAGCRAFDYHSLDLALSILGAGIWGFAAIKMKDTPLIAVNVVIGAILIIGVFK